MTFVSPSAHGPIMRVTDGGYVVRGTFTIAPGVRIGRTMTVLERGGALTILNAIRLSPEGEAELDRLGTVKHLVKLSDSHGIDEPYWVDRYRPEVWAMRGATLCTITASHELGPRSPFEDATVLEYPGAAGWRECALLVKSGGGTLVTCDAVQNHVDTEGASLLARVMTPILGFTGGVIVPRVWRRRQKLRGAAVTAAFAPMLEHSFAMLVTGHGPAVTADADRLVRRAVEAAASAS